MRGWEFGRVQHVNKEMSWEILLQYIDNSGNTFTLGSLSSVVFYLNVKLGKELSVEGKLYIILSK